MCGLASLVLAGGCTQLGKWRSQQLQQIHSASTSPKVVAPATPPAIPADVRDALPLDPSFTITSYTDNSGSVKVEALSAWGTEQTAQWMLSEMERRGYYSEDNASSILTGASFTKADAKFGVVKLTVTMNTAEQCLIQVEASPG